MIPAELHVSVPCVKIFFAKPVGDLVVGMGYPWLELYGVEKALGSPEESIDALAAFP